MIGWQCTPEPLLFVLQAACRQAQAGRQSKCVDAVLRQWEC